MYIYQLNLINDYDYVIKSEFNFEDFTEMLCNTDRCLVELANSSSTKVMIYPSKIISVEFLKEIKLSKDEQEEIKTKNNSYLNQF